MPAPRLGRPQLFFLLCKAAQRAGALDAPRRKLLLRAQRELKIPPEVAKRIMGEAGTAAAAEHERRLSKSEVMSEALSVALADGVLDDEEEALLLRLGDLFQMPRAKVLAVLEARRGGAAAGPAKRDPHPDAPGAGATADAAPGPAPAEAPRSGPSPAGDVAPVPAPTGDAAPAPAPAEVPRPDPAPPRSAAPAPDPSADPPPASRSADRPPPAAPRAPGGGRRAADPARPLGTAPDAKWTRLDGRQPEAVATAAVGASALLNVLDEVAGEALAEVLPPWLGATIFFSALAFLLLRKLARQRLPVAALVAISVAFGGGGAQLFAWRARRQQARLVAGYTRRVKAHAEAVMGPLGEAHAAAKSGAREAAEDLLKKAAAARKAADAELREYAAANGIAPKQVEVLGTFWLAQAQAYRGLVLAERVNPKNRGELATFAARKAVVDEAVAYLAKSAGTLGKVRTYAKEYQAEYEGVSKLRDQWKAVSKQLAAAIEKGLVPAR